MSATTTGAMCTVIIPAARDGPTGKPCWLQQHPAGRLAIHHMLASLDLTSVSRVILVTHIRHIQQWLNGDTQAMTQHLNGDARVVPSTCTIELLPLEYETSSAAATVAYAIRERNITGSIFVKDQDGSFDHRVVPGHNYVVGLRLTEATEVDSIPSKSFIVATGALLSTIVEKQIVSDIIGVGGYAFQDAADFLATLQRVEEVQARAVSNLRGSSNRFITGATESDVQAVHCASASASSSACTTPNGGRQSRHHRLFMSHIVQYQMLHERKVFGVDLCSSFCDWKTAEAWRQFVSRYRNVEVSLEGVLFLPSRPDDVLSNLLDSNDSKTPVMANIQYLQSLPRGRTKITVRTSRPPSMSAETVQLLRTHGVPFDDLIYSSLSATTYLVTSHRGDGVPHPSSVGYSVPESLGGQLGSVLHFPPH